jgi:hypothetical protein
VQTISEKKKSMIVPAIAIGILLIVAGLGYKFVLQKEGTDNSIQSKTAEAPAERGLVKKGSEKEATQNPTEQPVPKGTGTTAGIAPANVPQGRIADQEEVTPLELQVNILGQRMTGNNNYDEVTVKSGTTLRSNDNLQIHLRTSIDCYIYVLMYDSQGKANLLFPSSMAGTNNRMKGNRDYQIPGRNKWFFLDENTGTETIYVLADVSPMTDIDGLLADMERKGDRQQKDDSQKILTRINIRTRGIGGVTTAPPRQFKTSDGDTINNVTQVVKGKGALVWSVSFKHI